MLQGLCGTRPAVASWTRRSLKKGSAPTKTASGRSCAKVAKAALISRPVLALRTWICSPMARAAASTSLTVISAVGIGRIDEHGDASGCGHQLTQKLQPLCRQLADEKIDACQVAARPGEAGDQTKPDRVVADSENDRNCRGCRLGRQCRAVPTRRSPRRFGEPNRPPAPATDRIDPPPSDIRSPRSRLRHSQLLSGPGESRAAVHALSGDWPLRNPITGIAACCARAASGHAAAAPPTSVMNSRRPMKAVI